VSRPGQVVFESGPVVDVEIVETPEEMSRGLKGRTSLGENEGMLFLLGMRWRHSFWMKQTKIPLDLIFFDVDRVVGSLEMQPMDERSRSVNAPSTSALEVPGGWVSRHRIQTGERVQVFTK
jgi:uncharacterized protein